MGHKFCRFMGSLFCRATTQAQKILYCCYGATLAKYDERLTDEHPKAWPNGPVFHRTIIDINNGLLTVAMAKAFEARCRKLIKEDL